MMDKVQKARGSECCKPSSEQLDSTGIKAAFYKAVAQSGTTSNIIILFCTKHDCPSQVIWK
jgi:hypothetical protein